MCWVTKRKPPRVIKPKELAEEKVGPSPALKKMVCLVFEDTGPHRFNFYVTGMEECEDLPREYWTDAQKAGADAYDMVREHFARAGVVDSVMRKGAPN